MKKKLLLFVVMLAGLTSAYAAEGTITVANIRNAVPGYSGTLDVQLSGTDVTYTAFQFNITLPEGVSITGYTKGELLADHNINYNKPGDANMWIFTGNSGTVAPFNQLNGTLLTIKFTVEAGTTLGEQSGKFEECDMSESGVSHTAAGSTFAFPVTDMVTLYEDATEVPAAINGVKAWVDRTLTANKWNTLCLPFPMTTAQVDTTFGSDVEIGNYTGIDIDADDNIKVNFEKASSIEANHPYIVKVKSNVEGFGVTDATVDIAPEAQPMVNTGTSTSNTRIRAMIGVYEPTDLDDGWLYIKDNQFKYSTGASKLLPYRAYFRLGNAFDYEDNQDITSAPVFEIIYNGVSTGIKTIPQRTVTSGQYYDLQGRQVDKSGKGLHIINGKKVINK